MAARQDAARLPVSGESEGLREAAIALEKVAVPPDALMNQDSIANKNLYDWWHERFAPALRSLRAALSSAARLPVSGEPLIVGIAQWADLDTCLPASLRTITGLDVPDFGHGATWWNDYVGWLRDHGWAMTDDDGKRPVVGFSVAVGASPTLPDANHAVVALDGIVVWDPSPHRDDSEREFRATSYWPVFRLASGREVYDPFASQLPVSGESEGLREAARALVNGQFATASGIVGGPDPKPEDFTHYVRGEQITALREALGERP